MKKTRGQQAYEMNEIICAMNNEGAYWDSEWTWYYPDGSDVDECEMYYNDDIDAFDELKQSFKFVYGYYHRDGLYTEDERVVYNAHQYDDEFKIKHIENLYNK